MYSILPIDATYFFNITKLQNNHWMSVFFPKFTNDKKTFLIRNHNQDGL